MSNHSWHIQHITAPKINKIKGAAREKIKLGDYISILKGFTPKYAWNIFCDSKGQYCSWCHTVRRRLHQIRNYESDVSINPEQKEMFALRGFYDTHPKHFITSVTPFRVWKDKQGNGDQDQHKYWENKKGYFQFYFIFKGGMIIKLTLTHRWNVRHLFPDRDSCLIKLINNIKWINKK